MGKIFVDTDVVVDMLIDRKPFANPALDLFALAEEGHLEIFVSSLSFSNIYYIVRRLAGHKKALTLLAQLEKIARVLPVDEGIIKESLLSGFKDFEDAIQYFCARQAGIGNIITRNVREFSKAECAVHTPDSFLVFLRRRLPPP